MIPPFTEYVTYTAGETTVLLPLMFISLFFFPKSIFAAGKTTAKNHLCLRNNLLIIFFVAAISGQLWFSENPVQQTAVTKYILCSLHLNKY